MKSHSQPDSAERSRYWSACDVGCHPFWAQHLKLSGSGFLACRRSTKTNHPRHETTNRNPIQRFRVSLVIHRNDAEQSAGANDHGCHGLCLRTLRASHDRGSALTFSEEMERIAIIGCCGAGKSTLARELHRLTNLPLVHLDREFWGAGWKEPDKEEFRSRVLEIYQQESWIIDGHYYSTLDDRLARSEAVYHLDYSTWTCLRRTLGRTLGNLGRVRPDCAAGCPERFDFGFLRYVVTFRKNFRARTVELLKKHPDLTIYHFRHPHELSKHIKDREQAGASDGEKPSD
ncbi:MAG: hypothetical protein EAZ42_13480 [Verrucomicrobia bacterium]|nr:MAG: hypothetical protein EAZ42_13480 [Verrucomicrobiota bacterium]